MGLNAHCRVRFVCADLRLRFLRLSTIKKCLHMLRSDHRENTINKVDVGGCWLQRAKANTLIAGALEELVNISATSTMRNLSIYLL